MKIQSSDLTRYRHGEFLQFMLNALQIISAYTGLKEAVGNWLQQFKTGVEGLQAVFQPEQGMALSGAIAKIDERRDRAIVGIKLFLESMLYREEDGLREATTALLNNMAFHGAQIDKMSYQLQTAVINALLKDWAEKPGLAQATETLNLSVWVGLLKSLNTQFNNLYVERAQNMPEPAAIKQKREEISAAYLELTEDINAYARTDAQNKEAYNQLISDINGLIGNYESTINKRLSGKPGKDESEESMLDEQEVV